MPGAIHQTILKQCDELDGVKDGVIVDVSYWRERTERERVCVCGKGERAGPSQFVVSDALTSVSFTF